MIYLALFGVIIFSTTSSVTVQLFFILTYYINTVDQKSPNNIKSELDFLLWKPQICLMNQLH